MFSAYRRHGIIIALALLAGVASITAHPQARTAALPSIVGLTAGTEWRVVAAYTPSGLRTAYVYQEWQLRDARGDKAMLYLAATTGVQKMLRWTGEYGYEGVGYQVVSRRTSSVRLSDGTAAPSSAVVVQRLADRELLEYAVVSPNGIAARSADDLLRTAWDTLRGSSGPYYLVRISVAQSTGNRDVGNHDQAARTAARLLSSVLSALRADAHFRML